MQGGTTYLQCGRNAAQVIVHHYDVRGFDGDVRSRTNRYPHVGLGECGGIVDSISRHGHAGLTDLQFLHYLQFAAWLGLGVDLRYAHLYGYGIGGGPPVTGDHHHTYPVILQGCYGIRTLGPHRI